MYGPSRIICPEWSIPKIFKKGNNFKKEMAISHLFVSWKRINIYNIFSKFEWNWMKVKKIIQFENHLEIKY